MDHSAAHLPVWGLAPVTAHSPELAALLAFIGEDATKRDLERSHPYAAVDAVRRARSGDQAGLDAATHEASLQTSKAKVIADELAIRSAGLLLDVGGASVTKQSYNLDRHWRNAHTLASHNPGSYKARAIGGSRHQRNTPARERIVLRSP